MTEQPQASIDDRVLQEFARLVRINQAAGAAMVRAPATFYKVFAPLKAEYEVNVAEVLTDAYHAYPTIRQQIELYQELVSLHDAQRRNASPPSSR